MLAPESMTFWRDGKEYWTCCGKYADPGIYILNDHCARCHQPVDQALERCPRCPVIDPVADSA